MNRRKLGLTRDQYKFVGGDHDVTDQFETLFEQTNEDQDLISTLQTDLTTLSDTLSGVISVGSTSPYNLIYGSCGTLLVNSTVNPFIVNLPASVGTGWMPKIVNVSALATGLVKVVPASGEKIGPLSANTAAYLQNVDQSNWAFTQQYIGLVDSKTGQWAISGGQFIPEPGSVDTAGSQYHLGKWIKLPQYNTSARTLYDSTPPSASSYSSAITAWGVCGIPTKAKAIRAKVRVSMVHSAISNSQLEIAFSDNNSNTPSSATSHGQAGGAFYGLLANETVVWSEVEIPINSSGNFYIYNVITSTVTLASSNIKVVVLSYCMGV